MTTDPKVTEAIADGRVPDDITAAFLNQSKDAPAIAGIIVVTVLTSIVVLGRLGSRAFLIRRFGIDDTLTLLSWLSYIPFVALSILLINLGSGRHLAYIQYVLDMDTVKLTEVLDFASHIIYTTALLFCRISGLALYYRLCKLHNGLLISIRVVFGVLIAGYLPQLFLLIFHCLPVTGLWPYAWQPGVEDYICLQWGLVYSVNSGVSLLCDVLLFGIPIVMLRVLEMPRRRKIQLACILLPGILVIAISITRLVLVIEGQWQADQSWSYNAQLGVEVAEIGATLIALSVPGVKPLVDKFVLRKDLSKGSTGDTRYGKAGSSARGTALRSLNLRPEHNVLASRDTSAEGRANFRSGNTSNDNRSETSADGILVKVDFRIKEDSRGDRSSRHAS
ncbi:hypothetical protein B0J13DRAFT_626634 [Dactylonectria estremocensis]|uniref:Rhodopsin domain-containing protein n=1 Tax=Dactylonectria estremocensis TaxID=1079267 RepID=A0A9P9E6P5_9HYPO|nr:hypothetical protein B0J13DRAFT_626634 [Dactylonectria estremocensis]